MTDAQREERLRAVLRMDGKFSETQYDCADCKDVHLPHRIVTVPGPPTTLRKCTGCGRVDGPWVSADQPSGTTASLLKGHGDA